MRLNHIDLPVADVAAVRDFLVDHFDFIHIQTLGQDGLAIVRDTSGMLIVISRLRRTGARAFPDSFHIGFHLDSEDEVTACFTRLHGAGAAEHPPQHQRGAFAFYVVGPGELLVEIAYRAP